MTSRVKNGRFVTKKLADRHAKALAAMSKAKKQKNEIEYQEEKVCEERRIVELRELGKNLKCSQCKSLLDLEKMSSEKCVGLHSIFSIICDKCNLVNAVNTGKVENNVSHINAAFILGAVHSGVGNTALNKILACADVPSISNNLYKRYEKIIGSTIEKEAKNSFKRAAMEEKKLVIKNITKLCKEL